MELVFGANKWHVCSGHDGLQCIRGVNCYSYALNQPDYHWSVPGLGFAETKADYFFDGFEEYFAGFSLPEFKEIMIAGAIADGLTPVEAPIDRAGYYLVALFLPSPTEELDFHWYRKDSDGTWSHKNGWCVPSNVDARGHKVLDPRQYADTNYPTFGGFFLVPEGGVVLTQTFPLG